MHEKYSGVIVVTWIVIMLLFIGCFIGGIVSYNMSIKRETIQSKVQSLVPSDHWYTITFENGETYRVNKYMYLGIMDLNDSKHLIIDLTWSAGWFSPNDDNVWGITKITKW